MKPIVKIAGISVGVICLMVGSFFAGTRFGLFGSGTIYRNVPFVDSNYQLETNMKPDSNDARDLGEWEAAWQDVYVSGTVYAATISATNTMILAMNDLGYYFLDTLRVAPYTNDARDLGQYENAWQDVYASGTAFSNLVLTGDGSASAPSVAFANDSDTGLMLDAADSLGFVMNGAELYYLDAVTFAPLTNNGRDFGEYEGAWNDLFASGTAYLTNVSTTGDIDPTINNNQDIGQYDFAWKNVFASGTVYANALDITNNATINGNLTLEGSMTVGPAPDANNTLDIGEWGTAWKDVFASGTLYGNALNLVSNATINGDLTLEGSMTVGPSPDANNTLDIGEFGSAWNDIFASGTAYLNNIEVNGSFINVGPAPLNNNDLDIGEYETAWKDIYASGTVFGSVFNADGDEGIDADISVRKGDDSGACTINFVGGIMTGHNC